MTRRTRGREIALQVLYQIEQNPGLAPGRSTGSSSAGSATTEALRVRRGPDRGRPATPAADRRADLRGRRELAARPDGRHRPQHPPPRRLRDALLPRRPDQGRDQRGAGAGQAVQHRAVEPVRQRHPRPAPGRRRRAGRGRARPRPSPRPPEPRPAEAAPEPSSRAPGPSTEAATRPEPRRTPTSAARPPAADLHVHTTHSDGVCSPCEVVRGRREVGLSALAITDHDTLSALAVARPEAARLGVELIAGVELTAERDGREVHILGHFVRDDDPALVAAATGLRDGAGRSARGDGRPARRRSACAST